jgi:mono/diheme cytochrome c family protein
MRSNLVRYQPTSSGNWKTKSMLKVVYPLTAMAALVIGTQSCRNTSEIAQTDESGMLSPDVGEGKVIFMRDCTRCHEEKKVKDFTAAQWENILPRMIIQAQLNDDEGRQVTAYVEWALENEER